MPTMIQFKCLRCKIIFHQKKGIRGTGVAAKFCSRPCQYQHRREKRVQRSKTCKFCKNKFTLDNVSPSSALKWSASPFCSRRCSALNRGVHSEEEAHRRFLSKVRHDVIDGCWVFFGGSGRVNTNTYGWFKKTSELKSMLAHRYSYEHFKGAIPKNLIVRHTCDVKRCVNPEHLLTGTAKDNAQDAVARSRLTSVGAAQHRSITKRKALAIKAFIIANPLATQRAIAKRYKTSQGVVWSIRHDKHWLFRKTKDELVTTT